MRTFEAKDMIIPEGTIGIKRTTTNTVNDDVSVQWKFGTEDELRQFIADEKNDEDKWNFHTAGAMSIRYYDFEYLSNEDLETKTLADLDSIPLIDLLPLIITLGKKLQL